jgi:hypothetical protein
MVHLNFYDGQAVLRNNLFPFSIANEYIYIYIYINGRRKRHYYIVPCILYFRGEPNYDLESDNETCLDKCRII